MIRLKDGELVEWHENIQLFYKSELKQEAFCKEYGINYHRFCNMKYRLVYRRDSKPKWYEKYTPIVRKYLAERGDMTEFAHQNNMKRLELREMALHLNYLDRIDRILRDRNPDKRDEATVTPQKDKPKMIFHQVPVANLPQLIPAEPQIVEARNDIELIISKGVKVIISPELGNEKLIKIIELLKDL